MERNIEKQFSEIVQLIRKAKNNVLKSVNKELINLYWQVGEYINAKVESAIWGAGFVKNLAAYLKDKEPDLKGFSAQNLWRMKQFYETYRDYEKLSTLLRELPWSSHLHILAKTKSIEEKEFYIRLGVKERYSVRELEWQIDSGLYERTMISDTKLSPVLRDNYPKVSSVFRETYILDFLNLPKPFSEKDLRKGITQNLKDFLLEVGRDFTFIGEEYRLQVGNNDYFIDLLFYHRGLSCLVAFELKITDFKPEYLGKINFYLEALDRDVKMPHENPSVGVILCKSKDSEVVEYALSRNLSQSLVAEYKTKLIDKKVLQRKLHELFLISEFQDTGNDQP